VTASVSRPTSGRTFAASRSASVDRVGGGLFLDGHRRPREVAGGCVELVEQGQIPIAGELPRPVPDSACTSLLFQIRTKLVPPVGVKRRAVILPVEQTSEHVCITHLSECLAQPFEIHAHLGHPFGVESAPPATSTPNAAVGWRRGLDEPLPPRDLKDRVGYGRSLSSRRSKAVGNAACDDVPDPGSPVR
jgi:hypothetical protein